MAMRVTLVFAKPLSQEHRLRLLSAIAPLATSARLRVVEGGYKALVIGEELDLGRVTQALAEEGLACESIISSLADAQSQLAVEADRSSDPPPAPGAGREC